MTARKSSRRSSRRSNMNTTHLSNNRPNPQSVVFDLTTTRRSEVEVSWEGVAGTPGRVKLEDLVNTLPGGIAIWDKCQIHRFDVYGRDNVAGGATVALPVKATLLRISPAPSGFSDEPSFYSVGVAGARRAHLGIVPNELYRKAWIETGNTLEVLEFETDPNQELSAGPPATFQYSVTLQFTFLLRSTPSAALAPSTSASVGSHRFGGPVTERTYAHLPHVTYAVPENFRCQNSCLTSINGGAGFALEAGYRHEACRVVAPTGVYTRPT